MVVGGVVGAALLALGIIGCSVIGPTPEPTAVPPRFPLNPCPIAGPGSITPREGYRLLPPGEVAFAYATWHNETPDTFACGAQSIKGGKAILTPSDYLSGFVPWVATFRRGTPLLAPEDVVPEGRLSLLTPTGAQLVETIGLDHWAPQFGAMGQLFGDFRDPPPGVYRLQVVSASGEVLATGEFELRPGPLAQPSAQASR